MQLRLSLFIPQFLDLGVVCETTVEKMVVEFLRINPNRDDCCDLERR